MNETIKIKYTLEKCKDCPFFEVNQVEDILIKECTHPKSSKSVRDEDSIPEWCPLRNETEEPRKEISEFIKASEEFQGEALESKFGSEFSKPLAAEYLKMIVDKKWGIGY